MILKTLWPVVAGVGLFVALRRWLHRLPSIPSGDIAALDGGISRTAAACGALIAKADDMLRQWRAACLALLVFVVLLVAAMQAGT
jgi:hypothetical protein